MNDRRRNELRNRYIRLTREYDRIFSDFSCGRQLAEQINPRLNEISREVDVICVEVKAALGGAK